MSKLFAVVLATVVSMTAMAADMNVPRLSGIVKLDGRLEEPVWRLAARLQHSAFSRWIASSYAKDPTVFHLRMFHDGETLYVALVSYDRYVEADAAPENSDGLYSLSLATAAGKLRHYRLRWSVNPPAAGGEMRSHGQWGAHLRGPFGDAARPGGGYVLELAIPLASIGWKPGDTIPLNIIVHDHDGKPNAPYQKADAELARFAWGSFDNGKRAGYRTVELVP